MTILTDNPELRWTSLNFDPAMQTICDVIAELVAEHIPSVDPRDCHPDLLPFYAYDRHAVAWTDELGEAYSRSSIEFAKQLNQLAGTEQGWYVLCSSLGATGQWQYRHEGSGDTLEITGATLVISPPPGIESTATLLSHIAKVAQIQTVPYDIELIAVVVSARFDTTIKYYTAFDHFHFGGVGVGEIRYG